MYRVKSGKGVVVFLCFCSGKCVITGGKTRESIMQEWTKFYSTVLCNYKSTTDYGSAEAYKHQHKKTLDNNESWVFQEVMYTSKNKHHKKQRKEAAETRNEETKSKSRKTERVSNHLDYLNDEILFINKMRGNVAKNDVFQEIEQNSGVCFQYAPGS